MLNVEALWKQYASTDGTPGGGVFGIGFEVAEGELFTLLGPSGCGKTTTLRSIAGLEEPEAGTITLAGKDVFDSNSGLSVPMHNRDIGMVFQSYAIWPHMTVFENAAYPLKVSRGRRFTRREIEQRVVDVLKIVGMDDYLHRPSTQLSGGQQQRLALARALTRQPRLMLLDEPLSNLDAQLREQMRLELKDLQRKSGVTSIYVTHDQSEALAISDRIAVMNEGRIVQIGSPNEIYERPNSEFVANFIGKTNLLRGKLVAAAKADTFQSVETAVGLFRCYFSAPAAAGGAVAFVIRPENLTLAGSAADAIALPEDNRVVGRVRSEIYLGEIVEYGVEIGGETELVVRIAPGSGISVGDELTLRLAPEKTIALVADRAG